MIIFIGIVVFENGIGEIVLIEVFVCMGDVGDVYVFVDGNGNVYGVYVIDSFNEMVMYYMKEGMVCKIVFMLMLKCVDDGVFVEV